MKPHIYVYSKCLWFIVNFGIYGVSSGFETWMKNLCCGILKKIWKYCYQGLMWKSLEDWWLVNNVGNVVELSWVYLYFTF